MPIAAGRLQRWAIFLAMYDYHIEYKKGSKLGNADALSRLPLPNENDIETENVHAFTENSPLKLKRIAEHTQTDEILGLVHKQLMSGWDRPVKAELRPFFNKRLMLKLESEYFFERIHIDFFHFEKNTFLLLIDSFSRWLDVKQMKSTTGDKVIAELRTIFTYFGLPHSIVSDNGPPFSSKEFLKFCKNNNIVCLKSPPYHPQSNGWAECGVRTVKQSLRKMSLESGNGSDMALTLARFLIKYRNTPVTTTGIPPNDCIFRYRPVILMDALTSKAKQSVKQTTENHQQISPHNTSKHAKEKEPAKKASDKMRSYFTEMNLKLK